MCAVLFSNIVSAQNPKNSANPYDYAGKIHNELVSKYISEYANKDHSADEICQIIEGYAKNNSLLVKLGETSVDCSVVKQGVEDFSNQFRNVIKSSKMSSKAQRKAQDLIDYMFDLAFKSADTKYSEFYSYVVSY